MKKSEIAIIILAAGSSSRMGQPKQLLQLNGESLIRRINTIALECGGAVVLNVLGAKADQIAVALEGLSVEKVLNVDWPEGMSTSLRKGIQFLEEQRFSSIKGILMLLVDQPFVTKVLLDKLLDKALQYPETIVAASYENILGVPAFFPKSSFEELKQIKGDKGARKVLMKYEDQVIKIPFPLAARDLDTPADWEHFLNTYDK